MELDENINANDILAEFIKNLDLPVIIWKTKVDDYILYISNHHKWDYPNIINLKDYVSYLPNIGRSAYNDVVNGNSDSEIVDVFEGTYKIQRIDTKHISEIRLPNKNNSNKASYQMIAYFLDNMLSEPIGNIIGILASLDTTYTNTDNCRCKRNINCNLLKKMCYDVVDIINDMRDVISIINNKIILHPKPVAINKIIEEMYTAIVNRKLSMIKITVMPSPHNPKYLIIDKLRLLQIIENVLKSCRNFAINKRIHITINKVDKLTVLLSFSNIKMTYVSTQLNLINSLFERTVDGNYKATSTNPCDHQGDMMIYTICGYELYIATNLCKLMSNEIHCNIVNNCVEIEIYLHCHQLDD